MGEVTEDITDDEAQKILSRFNASHWNSPTEHARYSIPADPKRDDDIRLQAYIDQNRKRRAALDEITESWARYSRGDLDHEEFCGVIAERVEPR